MTGWIKGNRCTEGGGNCVEVRTLRDGSRLVRDSKHPEDVIGPFTPAEWAGLVMSIQDGDPNFT